MEFFTGQVLSIAFGYAPKYTAFCQGQLLPVNQNQALFALLGIVYGGDGRTNFGLPNTGGRTIVGFGTNGSAMALGSVGGEASHVLTLGEIPSHTHNFNVSTGGTATPLAANAMPGTATEAVYGPTGMLTGLGAGPLVSTGGGQGHTNMQPSTPINFAIVLAGIYPSRN